VHRLQATRARLLDVCAHAEMAARISQHMY